jgi:amino acid transporter, AAT family
MAESFDKIAEREGGLRRGLGSAQLSMIAIGGAIGTGLFLGSGFAIGFAGPSVLVSYAIGAVIALLLMGCLAEMTVAHPVAGSFGAWAEYYIGARAGFLVRYAYWTCIVFAVGTEVTAIAVYMRFWWPGVPGWVWIVGFSAVLIAVNALNVGVFGVIEYSFSALKVTAILAFIALAGWFVWAAPASGGVGFANYASHGGFFPKGLWGCWAGVIVALFSYFSIEMIAVAAGEAKDPQRAVTQAFRATIVRLILFYLLTLALMLAVVPWVGLASSTAESPFVKVMAATHIPHAAGVVNFVILVAALSAMNSQLYISTRMMFSLSRAGFAPARLGALSARGVPVWALLLSTLGIALATVLYVLYPDAAFTLMMAISMFGAMFVWMMVFVTHLYFRRAHRETLAFRMPGYPFTSALGIVLMAAALVTTLFTREFRMTLVYGVPFLLVLVVVYQMRSRKAESESQGTQRERENTESSYS